MVEAVDCGGDLLCGTADDLPIDYFDVMSERVMYDEEGNYGHLANGTELSAVVSFSLAGWTQMGRKYQITLPAEAFLDFDEVLGPAEDLVVEFTRAHPFHRYSTPDAAGRTADEYEYELRLPYALGDRLSVCYCNANLDVTLQPHHGATTYTLRDDTKCSISTDVTALTDDGKVGDRRVSEHQCTAKCASGCTGPFCYCDAVSDAGANTLCLPAALCREACEAAPDCVGIQVHDENPHCELLFRDELCLTTDFGSGSTTEEDWQVYTVRAGAACTHAADFAERAGTLHVTARIETRVDYVIEPGVFGALEVTVPHGTPLGGGDLDNFKDRVTVIDCEGICGVSSPSAALASPEGAGSIAAWSNYAASPGMSSYGLLHFPNIEFKSGGTFKLCFCDHTRLSGPCARAEDFAIEVGTVHASGVSCLVAQPKLQRAECAEQREATGLRCYGDRSPPLPDCAEEVGQCGVAARQ